MRILLLTTLILLFISTSFCTNVFANEASFSASYLAQMMPTGNDIGKSKITPDSLFYFLKAVREEIEWKLAFTPHVKMIRTLEFATRRLREVKSLISKREDLIPATLERYGFYLNKLPDKGLLDKELEIRISETLTIHMETILNIYDLAGSSKARLSLRSLINRISQRADLNPSARVSACYFLQKEATSSALLEVERQVLLERAQSCFKGV